MEFKTKFYEEAMRDFLSRHPWFEKDAIAYEPRHGRSIRVFLRDGGYVDYDAVTRYFRERKTGGTDDEYNKLTDEECLTQFADNLRDLMGIRGFSQSTLAERTGLSQALISKYLRKTATPSLINVRKIANALDCTTYELIE